MHCHTGKEESFPVRLLLKGNSKFQSVQALKIPWRIKTLLFFALSLFVSGYSAPLQRDHSFVIFSGFLFTFSLFNCCLQNCLIRVTARGREALVTDFGLAREVVELPAKDRKLSLVGSAFWMAPEMLRGEPYDRKVYNTAKYTTTSARHKMHVRQGKFIYIVHFIHRGTSMCFTRINAKYSEWTVEEKYREQWIIENKIT